MKRSTFLKSLVIFISLVVIPASNTLADDLEKLIAQCGMCHGKDGNSPSSAVPSVAGFSLEFFRHTMDAYKNDGRKSDVMKSFVHTLTEHQLDEIGIYYQKQPFIARDQKFDATLAKKGKALHYKYCEKCHENEGRVTDNNYGVLAGQWMPYLTLTINEYLEGKRPVAPMMVTKLKALKQEAGEEGIKQVVHYYASVK